MKKFNFRLTIANLPLVRFVAKFVFFHLEVDHSTAAGNASHQIINLNFILIDHFKVRFDSTSHLTHFKIIHIDF